MFQKLCITFSTLLLVTACGGGSSSTSNLSSSAGSDTSSTGVSSAPGNASSTATSVSSASSSEPSANVWFETRFDTADDIDTWSFRCPSGCNATAALTWSEELEALTFSPEWAAATDELEVYSTISPEIIDMSGGYAHFRVYVPEAYTTAASVDFQLFFMNATDNTGYIGYRTATAGWNSVYLENIQSGAGDGDYGSFGWHSGDFDLEGINRIGIQIKGAAGLLALTETLAIDDVIISAEPIEIGGDDDETPEPPPALEPGDISFNFVADVEGWNNHDSTGSTVEHDEALSALVVVPDWALADEGGNRPKTMGVTTESISEATIQMLVFLTQTQIDGGLALQPYIQQNAEPYSQVFGPIIDDLEAGANVLTWQTPELLDAMRVGLQLVGPISSGQEDSLLVMQVEITLPTENEEPTDVLESITFVDGIAGWSNSDSLGSSVSHNPELQALVLTPDWENSDEGNNRPKAMGVTSTDMSGKRVEFVVTVTQAQVDGGLQLQPYVQQNDGTYAQAFGGYLGGLVAGDNTLIFDAPDEPVDAMRFGVQLIGPLTEGAGDVVLIKRVDIQEL